MYIEICFHPIYNSDLKISFWKYNSIINILTSKWKDSLKFLFAPF